MTEVLPNEVTAGLHVMDGIDRTREITVAHLLSHTSGLADYYEEAPPGEKSAAHGSTARAARAVEQRAT